ncbi:MAG TPA: Sec-independent protein translocase subunit TatA [Pseudonocardiaceae bacterium]|nr:Sec-independent protein translocase subunit TatA [Pseudonocardiaceae bacterium]
MPSLGGWELLILLGVLVLLFGATKLPGAARAIGQSMRILKAETRGMRAEEETTSQATPPTSHQASQPQPLPPSGPTATPVQEPQRHTDTTR